VQLLSFEDLRGSAHTREVSTQVIRRDWLKFSFSRYYNSQRKYMSLPTGKLIFTFRLKKETNIQRIQDDLIFICQF